MGAPRASAWRTLQRRSKRKGDLDPIYTSSLFVLIGEHNDVWGARIVR
jgi:hypothetical protein